MTPRTLLILALCSSAAWAQDPTAPPLVTPGPAEPACKSYADCAPGLTCFAGACEPSCSSSADCAQGLRCIGRREVETGKWARGVCRDGSAGTTCDGPRDCNSGLACTGRRPLTGASGFESFCRDLSAGPDAAGPQRFAFQEPVPEGFHVVSELSRPLLGGGLAALLGGYALSLVAGLGSGAPLGAIPIVGPFFVGTSWWTPPGAFLSSFANFWVVLLVGVDFAAQGAGVAMLSVAAASPNHWLERNVVTKPVVSFVPGAAGSPLGASFVGRF